MVVRCEEVWREISNYIDGELDPALRAAMNQHIAGCRKCKSVLDGAQNLVTLYSDERMFPLPLGFSSRLRRRLEERMPGKRGTAWGWMVAFAAAVLLAGTLVIGNSSAFIQPALRSEHARPGIHVPPEMMVVVAANGKTFHVQGCDFIHDKTVRSMPAKEAIKEGYTPCVRCMRKYLSAGAFWMPRLLNHKPRYSAR